MEHSLSLLDPAPTENMEYLYTTDGTSYENLIDNAQNAECTDRVDGGRFNTDYFSYANRIWIVGSGDQAETYRFLLNRYYRLIKRKYLYTMKKAAHSSGFFYIFNL